MQATLLLPLLLAVSSCGYFKKDKPDPDHGNQITEEQKQQLREMRSDIELWARKCSEGIACGTKGNGVAEDGDSTLWAGLLCLSGEQEQCEATRLSVDSEGGLHRNPDKDCTANSASRDMFIGFLAYLAKTGDESTGLKTEKYIRDNGYKLCTDADNNRCNMNQPQYNAGWNLWFSIWKYHSFEQTAAMKRGKAQGGAVITSIQSIFATEGYPRHLVGAQLYIYQEVDDWSVLYQNAAEQLTIFQPNNPFFEYVANGPTTKAARITLEKCPREQPQPSSNDWAWQRDESEKAWLKAKGWDCIFMANVLLGDRK